MPLVDNFVGLAEAAVFEASVSRTIGLCGSIIVAITLSSLLQSVSNDALALSGKGNAACEPVGEI